MGRNLLGIPERIEFLREKDRQEPRKEGMEMERGRWRRREGSPGQVELWNKGTGVPAEG